jgi:hypothetical protein
VTRIAEGVNRRMAAPIEGVTLRGAGFPGATFAGPRVLEEEVNLGPAGGDVLRAITPAERLRPGAEPGSIDGFDSIAGEEFEFAEGAFATDSASRVLSPDFSSEGEASSSVSAPEELVEESGKVFAAGGVEVREAASPGRSGCAGERAAAHSEPDGQTDHREQKHDCERGDMKSGNFEYIGV